MLLLSLMMMLLMFFLLFFLAVNLIVVVAVVFDVSVAFAWTILSVRGVASTPTTTPNCSPRPSIENLLVKGGWLILDRSITASTKYCDVFSNMETSQVLTCFDIFESSGFQNSTFPPFTWALHGFANASEAEWATCPSGQDEPGAFWTGLRLWLWVKTLLLVGKHSA